MRNAAVRREHTQATADVDRAARIERRESGHDAAADGRVGRRVRLAAVEERQFKFVSINWHIPVIRQFFERADMVEMSVRQHDRGRLSVFTESLGGQPADTRARTNARNTRIDQHPAGLPWRPQVSHIDDWMALIRQIGGNFDCAVVRLMSWALARFELYLPFHLVFALLFLILFFDVFEEISIV